MVTVSGILHQLALKNDLLDSYPAYLCFEGQQDDVQTIVKRIKALQWHAITVKTEEPYTFEASESCSSMDEIHEEALKHCLLANGHSALDTSGQAVKLRMTMDEVQSGKELVARWVITDLTSDYLITGCPKLSDFVLP